MRFTTPRRRGLASLELVLSLPFLLAVAVIIASLAKVALAKSSASIEARADAWRKRPAAGAGARPTLTPADFVSGTGNVVSGQGSKSVRLAPVLEPSAVTAQSSHFVLAGTWDHQVLRPGAGQLQADPLMAAFAGDSARELASVLGSINEGNFHGVSAIRAALEAFRDVLADLKEIQDLVHKLVKALKPGSSGSSGGGVAGQVANALGGAGHAAAGVAEAIPLIGKLWTASRKLIADSAKLGQKLPALVQAVSQLPQTSIGGQSLPKGQNLQAQLQQQLQKLALQQLGGKLGTDWSPAKIKAMIDDLTKLEEKLKQAVEDFETIANFIESIGNGQLFRYANF